MSCHLCKGSFCAWCMTFCGGNAHPHVLRCAKRLNGDSYFGSDEQFAESNRQRQAGQLAQFLPTLTPALAKRLLQALRRQLDDAGLWEAVRRFE